MGKVKLQMMKSIHHIKQQPDSLSSKMHIIVMLDIGGCNGNSIAEQVGLTPNRISIIRNSPLYLQERNSQMEALRTKFLEKKSDALSTGDPVETLIRAHCMDAVKKKIELMDKGRSEFVQNAAASDLLDRGGYKSHSEKTKLTVEVTEKMADRFEKVLGYERDSDDRQTKVKIESEMSK